MADSSKVFRLAEGMTVVGVGEAIMGYLSSDHNMYAEGITTPEGYFLQAKSQDSGWKKLAGMSKATQVQIIASGDLITVSIGSFLLEVKHILLIVRKLVCVLNVLTCAA